MCDLTSIVEHYEEFGDFTERQKKEIVKAIVSYFLHFKIWLERRDFPKVTKLIVDEFPTEDPLYYYKPSGKGHLNPKGILYHRFNNQSGNWRSKYGGIYKNNVKKPKNKKIEKEISGNIGLRVCTFFKYSD